MENYNKIAFIFISIKMFYSSIRKKNIFILLTIRFYSFSTAIGRKKKLYFQTQITTSSHTPILWLPMSYIERSRLIRWRMDWLPGGRPKPCIYHPHDLLTRSHAITCLHMHHRLLMPSTVSNPLSYLLNLLPTSRKKPNIQRRSKYSAWFIRWPIICQILHELDHLHHDKTAPEIPPLGTKLLHWFSSN
jgi:hypothetical protein